MISPRQLVLQSLVSILLANPARAVPRTVIIDDELGDSETGKKPTYTPPNGWIQGSECTGCAFRTPALDPTLAHSGTWHDTTHHTNDPSRSVMFPFRGSSLEVFCILPNPSDPVLTSMYDLEFFIDGNFVGPKFFHETNNSDTFIFDAVVFSNDSLGDGSHTFKMLAASTEVNSTILFDYATYTYEDGESVTEASSALDVERSAAETSATTSSVGTRKVALGAILGGALGGVVLFTVLIALLVWRRRRSRLKQSPIQPFTTQLPPPPPHIVSVEGQLIFPPRLVGKGDNRSNLSLAPRSNARPLMEQSSSLFPSPSSKANTRREVINSRNSRKHRRNLSQPFSQEPPPRYTPSY